MAAKMAARKRKAPKGYATTGLPSLAVTRAVLQEINRIRAAEGWPPVQALLRGGRGIHASRTCPVARTIRMGMHHLEVRVWGTGATVVRAPVDGFYRYMGRSYSLGKAGRRFVAAFDAGRYPGLRAPDA